MKKLYFITSNKGKLQEALEKLQPYGYSVIQKDLGYPEIQADSLEEVVAAGISYLQSRCHDAFILEDAGVFIDALEGFPGVYSKYVFFTIGLSGILRLLEGIDNRKAVFRSVYGYCEPGKKPMVFIGECPGQITTKKQGDHGFGYDPIFIPDGAHNSFAEMTVQQKNEFSHRAKALNKLIRILSTKSEEF
ncbi:MAG: XTP/dITP diphosphatase [Candidatus Thermoplasmatota archaeon]|nr:XTP/dITP diphosphatase [Candidatus Thermoplasmatota archaeon]